MDNKETENLQDQIYHCANLINRSHHYFNKEENKVINTMHRGQDRFLNILLNNDGLSQNELVRIMDIRPSSVGELTYKLEQNGFIKRIENENDKRIYNIYLTDEGRTIAEEMKKMRNGNAEKIFSGLTANEQKRLSSLLKKLTTSIKEKLIQTDADFDWDADSLKTKYRQNNN